MLSKKILSKKKIVIHNLGQNRYRLFHIFTQYFFVTSEVELDYYYKRVHERVGPWVVKRLKILGNKKEISKLCGDMLLSNLPSKNYFLAKAAKTSKGEIKVFWSNQTSLGFLIFSKIFCHDCGRASFNTSTMNTILFL